MTFSVILSVHHKYWLRLLCACMFFLYFRQYYSFIETYSIRYDKTLLYIFMFRCDNILILPVLPAFEPNRIVLRFHLKYLYNSGSPPAGAGKTDCDTDHFRADRDHPRRCGENFPLRTRNRPETGSPPQVRGKRNICILREDHNGITPAGAGKTSLPIPQLKPARDHPRRCGENEVYTVMDRRADGSPPQVRGKQFYFSSFIGINRITPADAGKTCDRHL